MKLVLRDKSGRICILVLPKSDKKFRLSFIPRLYGALAGISPDMPTITVLFMVLYLWIYAASQAIPWMVGARKGNTVKDPGIRGAVDGPECLFAGCLSRFTTLVWRVWTLWTKGASIQLWSLLRAEPWLVAAALNPRIEADGSYLSLSCQTSGVLEISS